MKRLPSALRGTFALGQDIVKKKAFLLTEQKCLRYNTIRQVS